MDLAVQTVGLTKRYGDLFAVRDLNLDVPKGSNAILVTNDLTPSLTLQLDRGCIEAIATDPGTATAHVAILARSLGLPAVVGLRNALSYLKGGERAILNGTEGTLLIAPTESELDDASRLLVEQATCPVIVPGPVEHPAQVGEPAGLVSASH